MLYTYMGSPGWIETGMGCIKERVIEESWEVILSY